MNTRNGTMTFDAPVDSDLAAIARSMILGMQGTASKVAPAALPDEAPSLLAFASRLDQLATVSPELKQVLEETMARAARQALAAGDASVPSIEDFLTSMRAPAIVSKGGTYTRVDWWGFQTHISHDDLSKFLVAAIPLTAITATLVATLAPPTAPFVAAIAAFVAAVLTLLKVIDYGRGVYITMSWFAPGVFVPTSA